VPKIIEGGLVDEGGRYAIVASRFNDFIVNRLVDGAVDTLLRHNVADERITLIRVPGAWELPILCRRLAESGQYDVVIALGCVIRGSTPHFEYVAGEAAKGCAAAMQSGVPIVFGVLTTESIEQAIERAGTKMGNKGAESALAALEMVNLFARLRQS
jgi:6,7-dimethyl-8-ribityllumazine synthase